MPKAGLQLYNLRENLNSNSGFAYTAKDHLYAWYKFDQDLSSTGDLVDNSGNSRDLTCPLSSDRPPAAPHGDSPGKAKGFVTHSTFLDDVMFRSSNSTDFVFTDAFTISAWVKLSIDNSDTDIICEHTQTDGNTPTTHQNATFKLQVSRLAAGGQLKFHVCDSVSNGRMTAQASTDDLIKYGEWVHIVATYDGYIAGISSGVYPSLNIYKNGKKFDQTRHLIGSFNRMRPASPSSNFRFHIGWNINRSSASHFRGSIAQVALWSKELSEEAGEIEALYTAAQGAYKPKSGYLTNPARTIIRESDFRTGSYPTNLRLGDPDFKGNQGVRPFDDLKVVEFSAGSPQATIFINKGIDKTEGIVIGLTSSSGIKRSFELVRARRREGEEETSYIQRSVGAEPVKVKIFQDDTEPTLRFSRVDENDVSKIGSSEHIAYMLAIAINNSENFGIKAIPLSSSVRLERIDGNGSGGNTVSVYGLAPGRTFGGGATDNGFVRVTPFFDDSKRINAATRLSLKSPFSKTNVSVPNNLPTLEINGGSFQGVADQGIHFTPGENISPFDDRKASFGETDFYRIGTPESVMLGFNSPLRSKTQIVLSLSSSNGGTPLHFATGAFSVNIRNAQTQYGPAGTHHPAISGTINAPGFSYWDDVEKKWTLKKEEFFNPTTGPSFNLYIPGTSMSSQTSVRIYGYRGFTAPVYTNAPLSGGNVNHGQTRYYYRLPASQSQNISDVSKRIKRLKGVAQPTNSSLFPLGMQYQPSGSQYIEMKNHISTPFLVEKIKMEIDANLGISSNQDKESIAFRKIFILCQTNDPEGKVPESDAVVPVAETFFTNSRSFQRFARSVGHREIVAYGRIGVAHKDNNYSTSPLYEDLKDSFDAFVEYNDEQSTAHGLTSSFVLETEPRLAESQRHAGFFQTFSTADSKPDHRENRDDQWHFARDRNDGGPTLQGIPSGRQVATSFEAADIDNTNDPFVLQGFSTGSYAKSSYLPKKRYSRVSPYLLFPEDKLIIGWENIPEFYDSLKEYAQNLEEMVDRIRNVTITLYGSQIAGEVERHDTSNQPLNSDGIHEAIYGAPVLDQWDVEPLRTMTGSIYDEVVHGIMYAPTKPHASSSVRGSISSRTGGGLHPDSTGVTGSFSRTAKLFDNNVVYRDSSTPPPGAYLETIFPRSVLAHKVTIGAKDRRVLTIKMSNASPTRGLAGHLGLFNNPTINNQRTPKIPKNPFQFNGKTVFTTAPDGNTLGLKNLVIQERIFSGSLSRIEGVAIDPRRRQNRDSSVERPAQKGPPAITFMLPPTFQQGVWTGDRLSLIMKFRREDSMKTAKSLYNIIYGIPKYLRSGSMRFPVKPAGTFGVTDDITGFKYGLMNSTPVSPMYHFSRSSHGQIRDLHFSPPEGQVLGLFPEANDTDGIRIPGQDETGSPVEVRFMSRAGGADVNPKTTNCQNLSSNSTSSFPYFDGLSKDRNRFTAPPPDGDIEEYEIDVEL